MALNDTRELGQFIPLHYHYQMLYDKARIEGFRTAIHHVVRPDSTVLELGSGTGILSYFAAEKARKVYSVELNLDLVDESRRLLRLNSHGDKVELIHGDAFEYIPPETVDVVICEMLHVGLLREKQLAVIDAFKNRYKRRFENPLPVFIPEAVVQAVQPVQHDFYFQGFYAPIVLFQHPYSTDPRTTELGDPMVYHQLQYGIPYELSCRWNGTLPITFEGTFNALRIITKNILAIVEETRSTIDWHNQYLILPLEQERKVMPGQSIKISLDYSAGAPLAELRPIVTGSL